MGWCSAVVIIWFFCCLHNQHSAGKQKLFTHPYGNPWVPFNYAVARCQGRLPDDQTAHDELISFMESSGIWQAWLVWRRSSSPWTWIVEQSRKNSLLIEGKEGSDCGILESSGRLGARPCHYTLPVICQFSGVSCRQTYAAAYCVTSNGTTLLVAPGLQGWYTARAFCRHLGGDLATPQRIQNMMLAKSLMRKLPDKSFWIGARRNMWKKSQYKTEQTHMTTNLWDADQPGSGDCVVLQQDDGRGFWSTTQCTALHQVVCATSHYTSTGGIIFPMRNYSDNAVVDVKTYKGLRKTNLTLNQQCAKQGVKSLTLPELLDNVDPIAQYMRSSQTTSVWLPFERKDYYNWTWQNGDTYSGKVIEDAPGLCASPDIFLGASAMYIVPCHKSTIGFICQYNDTKPCWQTYHPRNCFPLGSTTLVFGTRVQSWYVASALCTALGGQLAQLPQKAMVQTVLDLHKKKKTLQTTNFFHVGLYKVAWKTSTEGKLNVHNLWNIGNPLSSGTCSVMQLEGASLLWRSADCAQTHAVLCKAPPSTTTATFMETQTLSEGAENTILLSNSTFLVEDQNRLHTFLLVFAGTSMLAVVLILFAVIWRWRLRRQPLYILRDKEIKEEPMKLKPKRSDEASCSSSGEDITIVGQRKEAIGDSEADPLLPLQIGSSDDHDSLNHKGLEVESETASSKGNHEDLSNSSQEVAKNELENSYPPGSPTASNEFLCGLSAEAGTQQRIRETAISLHPERHKALLDHTEALQDKILLEGGDLLEKLIKREVLSEGNKRYIEEGHDRKDKIGRLISMMERKNNGSYEMFCDCLWATRQKDIVKAYLSTPVDFISAREKVIQYVKKEFKDIQIYTAEGASRPVPMDKIYVNVTWQRQDEVENAILQSHQEIFEKIQSYGGTRTAISGIAGSGKTSFMKYISQNWIEAHRNRFSTTENSPLKFYLILIPIILRLIRTGMSLIDVIKDQIPFISFLEAFSLSQAMSDLQGNALVILDGYDELVAHNVIDSIIRKDEYAQVSILVTTRPHGITLIRNLGSGSIEQLLYIYGFSKEQIKTYIKLFFDLPGQTAEKGECLISELLAKENYLSEMERVPIQLEIICLVWSVKQVLANNILDLYQNFIECLDFHMKGKRIIKYDLEDIVHSLCRLANSWTKYGSLKKLFSHKELSEQYQKQLDGMIKFGCLVKYHPSTFLDKSYWSFSHLTLQEYFLALSICQFSLKEEKEIKKMFSSVSKLERLEIVLKFICGRKPSLGNQILQVVLNNTTDIEECKRLMDLLHKLVPEYKDKNSIDLPLPRYVGIRGTESTIEKDTIAVLSYSDKQQNHRNLKHLSLGAKVIKDLSKHPQLIDMSYVKNLELRVDGTFNDYRDFHYIFSTAKAIQKLDITGINELFPSHEFTNVLPKGLTEIKLQGKFVIRKASDFADNRKLLEVLNIEETEDVEEKYIQTFCGKVNEGTSCKSLRLTIPFLYTSLLFLHVNINLTVKMLTKNSLLTFVSNVRKTDQMMPHIKKLKIRHISESDTNKKDDQGVMLGHLMCYLSQLLHLSLCYSNYTSMNKYIDLNMEGLVQIVVEKNERGTKFCLPFKQINKKTLTLKSFTLKRINLNLKGVALGQLVSQCPYLHTLKLCNCQLRREDVEQMAENMPASTCIIRLALADNNDLGKTSSEAAICLLLQRAPYLQQLDVWNCQLRVPIFLESAGINTLSKLRILDLGENTDKELEISSYLASMHRLQTLSVANCGCTYVPALLRLIAKLPPALTHLNVCDNKFGTAVVEVTEYKEKLAQLHKLNIGCGNQDELEAIREELQQVNPDMGICYKHRESFRAEYNEEQGQLINRH